MATRVTGGKRLKAFLRNSRKQRQPLIEVGFKDRRVAVLAAQHEFGNPQTRLPERPAFRLGIEEMHEAVRSELKREVKKLDFAAGQWALDHDQAVRIATLARDTVRRAYLDFHGAPLSERQRRRKAGSGYDDEQLVGAEGPKLIGHIHAYVDGVQV